MKNFSLRNLPYSSRKSLGMHTILSSFVFLLAQISIFHLNSCIFFLPSVFVVDTKPPSDIVNRRRMFTTKLQRQTQEFPSSNLNHDEHPEVAGSALLHASNTGLAQLPAPASCAIADVPDARGRISMQASDMRRISSAQGASGVFPKPQALVSAPIAAPNTSSSNDRSAQLFAI